MVALRHRGEGIERGEDGVLFFLAEFNDHNRYFCFPVFEGEFDSQVTVDKISGGLVEYNGLYPPDFVEYTIKTRRLLTWVIPPVLRVRLQFRRIHRPVLHYPVLVCHL